MTEKTSRQACTLHGAFHGENFGDLLMARLYSRWVRDTHTHYPALPFVSGAKSVALGVEASHLVDFRKSSALLYCGGGYLGEPNNGHRAWATENLLRFVPIFRAARSLGIPLAVIGAGAGPVSTRAYRRFVTDLVAYSSVFAVRDPESRDFLLAYGCSPHKVDVTADPVLSLDRDSLVSKRETPIEGRELTSAGPTKFTIGVHLSHNGHESRALANLVDDLARLCKARDWAPQVIRDTGGFGPRSRKATAFLRTLTDTLGVNDILRYRLDDMDGFIEELCHFDAIVTNKLHVGIVGLCLGVPVVAVAHHQKTQRLFTQLGLEASHVALEAYKTGSLADMLEHALTSKRPYVPKSVKTASGRNRTLLVDFLSGICASA
ncbi:MAG: polysaccharide pyruvyl transferase family protein [Congregibacter sp.]